MAIGAQAVGLDPRVALIVFGAGDSEAVAEPVELFGVDRVYLETTFEQGFHDRAVRHFDRHRDRPWFGSGHRRQPGAELRQPGAVMVKRSLTNNLAAGIDQAGLMRLARPVDAGKPLNPFRHDHTLLAQPDRRDDRQSLYRRSKRNLPQDFRRGQPAGVQVRPRCSSHGLGSATPGGSARSDQSESRPVHDRFKGTGLGWG